MGLVWYTHHARDACHICLSGIDTLRINRTYRNRKTERICICIRFVLYRHGIACAKEGTLRKCEGHDADLGFKVIIHKFYPHSVVLSMRALSIHVPL